MCGVAFSGREDKGVSVVVEVVGVATDREELVSVISEPAYAGSIPV
jgi:hypothetical protein